MAELKSIAATTVTSDGPNYRQAIKAGRHHMVADEPESAGGRDAGASPYGYVLAGLGACTIMTLQMYAQRKGWELGEVSVRLTFAKDSEGGAHIHRIITASGALDDAQWARLLEIAAKTPVTKTLADGATITSRRRS